MANERPHATVSNVVTLQVQTIWSVNRTKANGKRGEQDAMTHRIGGIVTDAGRERAKRRRRGCAFPSVR
ncbi:glycoside hydrolase family 18 protein [Anopheles sinensis]|uniref:Glycoside hydrolase family 18 protein n=1 Tax=Anopheles sinensis TaxID=74873 RepID=A0A084W864_ANOSI|nr:glycoside hydrolase family 18 protein [Anopheles sinensis]